MLEMLISPRKAEEKPARLFWVGLLYASISLLLTDIIFLRDKIMSVHAPLLIITFTTIFSIPFIHSLIRREEIREVTEGGKLFRCFKGHSIALSALMFLFLGYLAAFSFWYIVMPQATTVQNFNSQIQTFCSINVPGGINECLMEYGIEPSSITGKSVSGMLDVFGIFTSNLFVLFFTLIFSLTFGAGAIFILAWNASVIATAIGMLINIDFLRFYLPFFLYLTHGIPEIAAYLMIALAGGILSTAVIRHDLRQGSTRILRDVIILTALSLILLFIAAIIEVFITPAFFG